jgi:outer membrane murein-binding lipoprotein Lpp
MVINHQGDLEAMTYHVKRGILLFPLIASALLSGCVSQSAYDQLQAQISSFSSRTRR